MKHAKGKVRKYAIPRRYVALGEYLQQARLRADLTQRRVSDILGYSSAQFISNFENGIAAPPLDKLKVLMKLYEIPADKLLELLLDAEKDIILSVLCNGKKKSSFASAD